MRARYDWEAIRAGYEAGASRSELAGRYGVSGETIRKRIRAEGWTPDGSGIVNRAAGDPERDSAGSTACALPPGVAGTATARELPRNDAAEGAFCELPERGTVADATACESSDSAGTAFCELPESVAAPDRLAEARAAVITRHQREWDRHQGLVEEALSEGSLDKARLAKLAAETIRIRQEAERKAWGIVDRTVPDPASPDSSSRCPDLSRLSAAELLRLTREAFRAGDHE